MELRIYLDEIYQKSETGTGPSGTVSRTTETFGLYLESSESSKRRTRAFVNLQEVPSYMVVESAILRVRKLNSTYYAWVDGDVGIYRILGEWTEETLKTSNPELADSPEATITELDNNWKEFDITQYIQDLASGAANNGFVIRKTTEFVSWTGWISESYASSLYSDTTRRPHIIINYTKRAPRPPKNLTPTAETRYNNTIIRFEWEHDLTLEDTQSKFDLSWRKEGGTWTTITQTTPNQYYDMPVDTLPTGTIQWRVRTYGENGLVSDWTETAFLCAGKSAKPIVTAPPSQVNTSQPVVSWTAESQVYYQVQVLKDGLSHWDSGEVLSSATSIQVENPLETGNQYIIQVRTKNQFNIWTDWATKTISVDFGKPAEPSIKLIPENSKACMRIQIINPAEAGFRDNEVYRRIPGGTWLRIAKAVPANGVVHDWTLDGNIEFEYRVRAFNTNGGFADSPSQYNSIMLRHGVIGSTANTDSFIWLKYNIERQGLYGRERALNRYTGRTKPVPVFGEQRTKDINMSVSFRTLHELEKFIALCDNGDILLYRDNHGRKMYCSVGDIQTDEKKRKLTAGFSLTEVDYKEGV